MEKITGQDLLEIGYPEGRALGAALKIGYLISLDRTNMLAYLKDVLVNPRNYKEDQIVKPIVDILLEEKKNLVIPLKTGEQSYMVYGADNIEDGAIEQMTTAMHLPISVGGALMPDAHQGYGLPIGGVLACDNAVIPYGVGVDIGCRMAMTIYQMDPSNLDTNLSVFKNLLLKNTAFGSGQGVKNPQDDAVLNSKLFNEINMLKPLKEKAAFQIGSSGSGNHFVEFGIIEITEDTNSLGLKAGKYIALLTHSGSRGLGASIAKYYTDRAMSQTKLPHHAKHLAWLDLNHELGQEYWLAMNLAGDYAKACHDHIHTRISKALGLNYIKKIENHHNFAWKEQWNGKDVIVHRKGATPAGKGVFGIIPGSMTTPGYVVEGLGDETSINSASHGAGRLMSRTQAKNKLNGRDMENDLKKAGVFLIGGGIDECSMVYKDIEQVIKCQTDLVKVLAKFTPKIVRMSGE